MWRKPMNQNASGSAPLLLTVSIWFVYYWDSIFVSPLLSIICVIYSIILKINGAEHAMMKNAATLIQN